MLVLRGDRVDLETARIEGPAEAANDATLAGGIPSLKDDDRPLRGPKIGLLDDLQRSLQRRQTTLVVGKEHFWVFGEFREPRAARDYEVLRLHCGF